MSGGEEQEPFGPTIENQDLPADVVEQIEDVIADLEHAEKPSTLHRARVAAGLALFGAVIAGALFGWSEHADALRALGALASLTAARLTGVLA